MSTRVTRGLRIAVVGGFISFRALFTWLHPSLLLTTMLGYPLLQIVFFTLLGRATGVAADGFFLIGNAVQTCALAGVYAMVMALANEREFGTLPAILATPANRFVVFCGRVLPVIASGMVVSAFGLIAGCLVLGYAPPGSALPGIALTVALTAASCAMFGLALGAVGLRVRDVWVGANLTYFLLLLLSGANVPQEALPGWLAAAGKVLPLTHGIDAAHRLADGAALRDVRGLLGREALIGLAYGLLGALLLRVFETASRRHAALDRA
ncbi:MAG: ABC transporter permease [Hamadaea sp.]|nr:ABC transporter permease [Hamadaea sp.]